MFQGLSPEAVDSIVDSLSWRHVKVYLKITKDTKLRCSCVGIEKMNYLEALHFLKSKKSD